MAISNAVQTLTAAFSFGILLQAASGVLVLYFKGHGATIFRDGRRLVLVLFLFFAATWAQIDFLNLLIPTKSSTVCQVTLIVSTGSDQLARIGIEQFLLWSVGSDNRVTAERLITQTIFGIRLVAGGLLVGFTRPQFAPVCVAQTSLLPVAILVLALDLIIIGMLMIRAISSGMMGGQDRVPRSGVVPGQDKALVLCVVGFFSWTGTSAAMLLGLPTTLLILRTTLPSTGLFILIGVIAIFSGVLLVPKGIQLTTPEATSPFIAPLPPSRDRFHSNDNDNGSPINGHSYTRGRSLFVVNSSATPHDSPMSAFHNARADIKGVTKAGTKVTTCTVGLREYETAEVKSGRGLFPSAFTGSSKASISPQIDIMATESIRPLPALPPPVSQPRMSFFSRPKQAQQPSLRSLGISKPLMADRTSSQTIPRMRTIDLATAAANERERREGAIARSRVLANRPAPKPPLAPEEAFRKSISIKRKEMPGRPQGLMPTISSIGMSDASIAAAANGRTTSVSLSPAPDEVRRRSPRNGNNFDQIFSNKALSLPSLQSKQTLGLPSNPKSERVTMAKEQTVMFMSNIVYDNPGMVKTIINTVPKLFATSAQFDPSEKSPAGIHTTTLQSPDSVIHRPRPYRGNEKDRALFPSEPSPRHKRSKSDSSVTNRKFILMSEPGNPTQLPPLPPLPTSAAKLTRLLPNDMKSMTFDEKIGLLFPTPPGSTLIHHRRSSVPSLPRLPSVFIPDTPIAQSPADEEQQNLRASKLITIASFGQRDFISSNNVPEGDAKTSTDRQTYSSSRNTYGTVADEVDKTWVPAITSIKDETRNTAQHVLKLPIRDSEIFNKSAFTDITSSDASSHDETTTYWGSIHSEVPTVDLSKARRMATSTTIPRSDSSPQNSYASPVSSARQSHDGEGIMTVMLDLGASQTLGSTRNRQSFLLDANQFLPDNTVQIRLDEAGWHRRIGDELPTFSERKTDNRSRKVPPPTPLLLKSRTRNVTNIVRTPEPSSIDSPGRAIKQIQAQLKRFENPGFGSIGSTLSDIPNNASATDNVEDRIAGQFELLENLEMEIGLQEHQWQQMQNTLDRDSFSLTMSPHPPETSSSPVSLRQPPRTPLQIISRRARVRSSMTLRSRGMDSFSTASSQSSDNSRASIWQKRLAEAQMEYMENAPALIRKRSVNFLSLSRTQLGSSTPPDSGDSGADSEVESELTNISVARQKPAYLKPVPLTLWQPAVDSPKAAAGRMWNPPYQIMPRVFFEPPAKDIRPPRRMMFAALSIISNQLWVKPLSSSNSRPVAGLWSSRWTHPRASAKRHTAQRPQKKSKRVTFLPDIVESPQPLPNQRDTLGIFQFPWGEFSDSAVYQPAFNPTLLGDSILKVSLDARSRKLEPELEEYSSSFFDEYDEELNEDEESDDDFDDMTLWEIASLLKSKDVPSRDGLLSPVPTIIEDYDDETDFESESDCQSPVFSQALVPQLPIRPLESLPRDGSTLWQRDLSSVATTISSPNGLLQPDAQVCEIHLQGQSVALRAGQCASNNPSELTTTDMCTSLKVASQIKGQVNLMWDGNSPSQENGAAYPPIDIDQDGELRIPSLQPNEDTFCGEFANTGRPLRRVYRGTTAAPIAVTIPRASRPPNSNVLSCSLWSPELHTQKLIDWHSKSSASPSSLLWAPDTLVMVYGTFGLYVPSERRKSPRTISELPAVVHMTRRSWETRTTLGLLTSNELWKVPMAVQAEHHWISESSVRPESPSFYSETSSGKASPASASSSVRSNSTKGSSLWGSVKPVKFPAWWESRPSKELAASSPHAGKAKVPVRQLSAERLAPLRELSVLASRDIWKSELPTLKNTPVQELRNHAVSQNPEIAIHNSSRHDHRLAFISPNDWDAALSLAICQSRLRVRCPMYSPELWRAAIDEALIGSIPSKISVILESCDVSVRHPVFFMERLVCTAKEIHPAAFGYVTESMLISDASLWKSPSISSSVVKAIPGPLWPGVPIFAEAKLFQFKTLFQQAHKKEPLPRTVAEPELESISMWHSEKVTRIERHWLSSTGRSLAKTWVPQQREPERARGEETTLWVVSKQIVSTPSHTVFAPVRGERVIRNNSARHFRVSRLNSNTLFELPLGGKSDTHWLNATSYRSRKQGVRAAPLHSASPWPHQNNRLRRGRTESSAWSPSLFLNPHSEPWVRKKKEPPSITEIKSGQMWRRSIEVPESPNNWLKKRIFSRVEFRY